MGERSAIEWTEATWNPWRGCDKVSPGCAHCYMFTEQRRYGRDPSVVVRCSDSTFYAPVRSKKWREMAPGTHVFTCSWSDWFHEDADEWRPEAWEIVAQTPHLIYQVLTKRPERIADHLPPDWRDGYPNVWLGVTIENRRYVDRADLLRETPAAVRFISAEPLLGPVIPRIEQHLRNGHTETWYRWPDGYGAPGLQLYGIDWLICGGESGPKCRPFDLDWARDLRDHCADTNTAFFLKQLGGNPDKRGGDKAQLDGRRHTEMPTSMVVA